MYIYNTLGLCSAIFNLSTLIIHTVLMFFPRFELKFKI